MQNERLTKILQRPGEKADRTFPAIAVSHTEGLYEAMVFAQNQPLQESRILIFSTPAHPENTEATASLPGWTSDLGMVRVEGHMTTSLNPKDTLAGHRDSHL